MNEYGLLYDYLEERGLLERIAVIADNDNLQMYIDGRLYPVCLSMDLDIPEDLAQSIIIDGIRYRFSTEQFSNLKWVTFD